MLPVVHTLRYVWPNTRLTWVIAETAHALVEQLPGVEFVVLHKRNRRHAFSALYRDLRGRRFDGLLLMQIALRAGRASLGVRSSVRIGFDAARSKDGHRLFINHRIDPQPQPHVLEGLLQFLTTMGIDAKDFQYCWDLPEDPSAATWAAEHLPGDQPTVVLNACASHPERTWLSSRYASIIDHLQGQHQFRVVLTSAPVPHQIEFVQSICAQMAHQPINLAGQTDLLQLLALMRRSRFVIGPDSGPIHIATVAGRPAIGLYACSNRQRTGPYCSRDWCVDQYDAAAHQLLSRRAANLEWGKKLHSKNLMALITVKDVIEKIDALIAHQAAH